jgi:hypothetical protein
MKNFILLFVATFVAFTAWAQSPNAYTYATGNVTHNSGEVSGQVLNPGTDTLWYFAEVSPAGYDDFISASDTLFTTSTLYYTVTSLPVSNLLPSTGYYARLRAFLRDTLGVATMDVPSGSQMLTTLGAPQIGVVTYLTFAQVNETSLSLNLGYMCGNISTDYLVEYNTVNGPYNLGSMTVVGLQNSGDTLLTFNNLSIPNTYFFRVTPLNSLGVGDPEFGGFTMNPYAIVTPTISNVNVDPSFGTPSQVQVVSGFDLGTSVSANLTVAVYEADGTLIGTSGPMVQTASGIDTTTLAGFMYPGSVASYALVSIIDPVTQVGDTMTVAFISEPYVNTSITVSVDTVVNAPYEVLATVNVWVGDCGPVTVTPVLSQNGVPMQTLQDSTFMADGIWVFPISGFTSLTEYALELTTASNCSTVTEVATFVSPEQNFLQILSVTTTAIGPDSLVSTATFDSGDLPTGMILANVLDNSGTNLELFPGVVYAGYGTRTIAKGNLTPGATYMVRWTYIDTTGTVPTVYYTDTIIMPNVPCPAGAFIGQMSSGTGSFSQNVQVNPNGSWANSAMVMHYALYDQTTVPEVLVDQSSTGVLNTSSMQNISYEDLQAGGTYRLEVWLENGTCVDTLGNIYPVIEGATNPNLFLQFFDEISGNKVRSKVHLEANGNEIELKYDVFANGFLFDSFDTIVGSSTDDPIWKDFGPFGDCDRIAIQVVGVITNELFNPTDAVTDTLEISCPPLPNAITESIWEGLVITPEMVVLPSGIEAELQIVSMLGQVVLQRTFSGSSSFSLEPGAYLYRLVTKDGHITTRKIATL